MTNRSQDWSGKYLAKGRYKVIKKIGAGGHGCVYVADDTQKKRDVVIKVPHSQLLNVPGIRERFEREYRSLRELKHPNIVEIYEARESRYFDKTPYAVLQYLGGRRFVSTDVAGSKQPVGMAATNCTCARLPAWYESHSSRCETK